MTTLVAVGFLDQTTASAAAEHIHRLDTDVVLDPDAVAVITRDDQGAIHVTTSHHVPARRSGSLPGVFWLPLFSALCFIPLLGMTVGGAWETLLHTIERSGLVDDLREPVLDMLQPGTSILFLATDPAIPVTAVVDALRRFGGSMVTAPLPAPAEHDIARAIQGPSEQPVP